MEATTGLTHERANQLSSGVFLIGLAALFYFHYLWPGIMFVIGAASIIQGLAQGRGWYAFHSGLWTIAIGIWAVFHFNWAVMLATIGLSMVIGSIVRPPLAKKPVMDNSLE